MAAETVWRRWRRKVHDILEVGGDAHPASRVVNAFIITLIVLNAIAFAAETVDRIAARYGEAFRLFNLFSVLVFTVDTCCAYGARSRSRFSPACRRGRLG